MRKIFIYSVDNNKGGIENYTLNLIKSVLNQSKDYCFHILTHYNDFAFKDTFLNQLGCECTVLPNKKKHPLLFYNMIFDLLNANPNGLFQINAMSYCNSLVFKAAINAGIRTIIVGHASGAQNIFKRILHKINRARFINFGEKIAVSTMANLYMFLNKGTIIQNGIDKSNFLFNQNFRDELRAKYSLKESDVVIGQIGRISPIKNQVFTAKVFQLLPDNYHLFFIGKCQNKKMLRKILKYKNRNIHIIDENNSINKYYSMLDIFLLPSKSEGAPLSLYEALTSGCICFVSIHVPRIKEKKASYLKLKKKVWAEQILNTRPNIMRTGEVSECILTVKEQSLGYINLYAKK